MLFSIERLETPFDFFERYPSRLLASFREKVHELLASAKFGDFAVKLVGGFEDIFLALIRDNQDRLRARYAKEFFERYLLIS